MKEATWVPSSDLGNAKKAMQDFEGRAKPGKRLMRASTPLGGGGSRERNMSEIGSLDACRNIVLSSNKK